jgi:hypothetical protein
MSPDVRWIAFSNGNGELHALPRRAEPVLVYDHRANHPTIVRPCLDLAHRAQVKPDVREEFRPATPRRGPLLEHAPNRRNRVIRREVGSRDVKQLPPDNAVERFQLCRLAHVPLFELGLQLMFSGELRQGVTGEYARSLELLLLERAEKRLRGLEVLLHGVAIHHRELLNVDPQSRRVLLVVRTLDVIQERDTTRLLRHGDGARHEVALARPGFAEDLRGVPERVPTREPA